VVLASTILNVSVTYSNAGSSIVASKVVDGRPPASDPRPAESATGVWAELLDEQGEPVFWQALPQPDRPREIYHDDGSLSVVEGTSGTDHAQLSLPWIGRGGRLRIRSSLAGDATFGTELMLAPALLDMQIGDIVDSFAVPAEGPAFGSDLDFPVTELDFGKAHGNEIRLIFLPDGFTHAELPVFHNAVQAFLDTISRTAPFDALLEAFSACRADIPSPASGILDPLLHSSGANPFFRARFGDGALRRCIVVDQARAIKAATHLAGKAGHVVGMVVVNTVEYGGSGGNVAVFSVNTRSPAIAIHELGHTLFNLADEYADAGQSGTPDPIEINVAAKPDPHSPTWGPSEPGRLKWAAQITQGLPIPGPPSSPLTVVGAFEGAKYHPTGIFRPSVDCKMRNLLAPFCPVCDAYIRAKLQARLP